MSELKCGVGSVRMSYRLAAKAFAENHLQELARDLLAWRKTRAGLPEKTLFHELACICAGYTSAGDEYQEAEHLVTLKAIEAAASKIAQDAQRMAAV